MFQACVTKPHLRLIMEPECRLESTVRGYSCVKSQVTVVTGLQQLKFNYTLIWQIFQIRKFAKMFPSPMKPTAR